MTQWLSDRNGIWTPAVKRQSIWEYKVLHFYLVIRIESYLTDFPTCFTPEGVKVIKTKITKKETFPSTPKKLSWFPIIQMKTFPIIQEINNTCSQNLSLCTVTVKPILKKIFFFSEDRNTLICWFNSQSWKCPEISLGLTGHQELSCVSEGRKPPPPFEPSLLPPRVFIRKKLDSLKPGIPVCNTDCLTGISAWRLKACPQRLALTQEAD